MIDLGYAVTPPLREGGTRISRPAAICAAVALLFLTGGSGRAVAAGQIDIAPAAQPSAVAVTGDHVLVAAGYGDTATVSNYRVDGTVMWTQQLPGAVDHLMVVGKNVLAAGKWRNGGGVVDLGLTDGSTVADLPGQLLAGVPGGRGEALITKPAAGGGSMVMSALVPSSGHIAWTQPLPADSTVVIASAQTGYQGASAVTVVDPTAGRVTEFDAASGVRTATTVVAPTNVAVQAVTTANTLYISHWSDEGQVLAAYLLPGLHRLWTVPQRGGPVLQACGDTVCVNAGRALTVIDPRDGNTRWSSPAWAWGQSTGSGQVLVTSHDGEAAAVADARSGRILATLTGWKTDSATPGLVFHTDTRRRSRTWYGTASGGVRALGYLIGVTEDCVAAAQRLACITLDGRIAVTPRW